MSKTATTLTANQQSVIDALGTRTMTGAQLAAETGLKPGAISGVLSSLRKRGLVFQQDGAWDLTTQPGHEQEQESAEADLADDTTTVETGPRVLFHADVEEAPRPAAIRVPEFLADVAEECAARQAKGAAAVVVESKAGDYIRSAKVGASWITTDGMFACVKGTPDTTDAEPWALYLMTADVADRLVGTFRTSSTPFLVETQAAYRA